MLIRRAQRCPKDCELQVSKQEQARDIAMRLPDSRVGGSSRTSRDQKSTPGPGGASGEEPSCQCRRHRRCRFDPWVGKIPWEEEMATYFCILVWKILWNLVSNSPWTRRELDTTE